jgi:hypothetical protein
LAKKITGFMQEASGTLMACRLSGKPPQDLDDPTGANSK